MSAASQHNKTNRWIFGLMTFAFFWLVIGDLITLHQKAIYGFDPFSVNTPFTKTDNNHSKYAKVNHGSKIDKSKDQFHYDASLNKQTNNKTLLAVRDLEIVNTFSIFLAQSSHPLIVLRGPPTA